MATSMNYNNYFFGIAYLASLRSPYVSKKGCCIVDRSNRIVGIGWNGWPRGQTYQIQSRGTKPIQTQKSTYACHSEANAIAFRTGEVSGGRLYSTDLPCDPCAKLIVQCGIEEIHYVKDISSVSNRWIFSKRKNMTIIDNTLRTIEAVLLTQNCSLKLNNPKEELRFTIQEFRYPRMEVIENEDHSLCSKSQEIEILIHPQLCMSVKDSKNEIISIEEIKFTAQINDNVKLESGSLIKRTVNGTNCIYVIGIAKLDNITLKEIIDHRGELEIDFSCEQNPIKFELKLKVKVNKIKIEKWIDPVELSSNSSDSKNSINQNEKISFEKTTISFNLNKETKKIMKELSNHFRLHVPKDENKTEKITAMEVELLDGIDYSSTSFTAPSGEFNANIIQNIKIKIYNENEYTERELEDNSTHKVKLKISDKVETVRLIQEDSNIKNTIISRLQQETNSEEEE